MWTRSRYLNMDELTELAIKYGTDKWGKHHYTPVYYELFHNKSKRRGVKKVLEIGPAEGAGLKMFRDFFTHAMIYGAEIDQDRVDKLQGLERIQVYKCDQSLQSDLVALVRRTGLDLDLVVDDGSHDPKHQVFTCLQIFSSLPKGSIYIIEDVADDRVFAGLKKMFKEYDIQELRLGKRYDDRLIIIKK